MQSDTHIIGFLLALLGTTTKAKHQVKSGLLLNIIVIQSATILELFAGEDKTLLIRWNPASDVLRPEITIRINYLPFLVLNFGFNIVDGVRRLHLQSDGLSRETGETLAFNERNYIDPLNVLTKICITIGVSVYPTK
jgi:hypothetical protein